MTIMYSSVTHFLIFFRELTQLCSYPMTSFFLGKTFLFFASAWTGRASGSLVLSSQILV